MNYSIVTVALIVLLFIGVVWMFVTRGEKKIFTGKLVGLALRTVVFSFLFAMVGLLYKVPANWLNTLGLFLILLLLYSLFTWWYWRKQKLLQLDLVAMKDWELPQVFSIWSLATLVLLGGLTAKQLRYGEGGDAGAMLSVIPATLVLFLPLFVVRAHRRWNEIPIVIRYREPWMLPVRGTPPVIEPSADSLRIFFEVPVKEESEDRVSFDVSVPRRTSLGQVFHHLLYQHNVQDRSHRKIDIAFENRSEQVYGWLLFRNGKRWWGAYRDYLDMDNPVRESDLINGQRVFAERVRTWEN